MTKRTTPTLTATRMALVVALSRMPMTRMAVTASVMRSAGRFNQASGVENGSADRYSGMRTPATMVSSSLRYFDQEEATQAQAMAYSRTRSQPMIQANNSPRVA